MKKIILGLFLTVGVSGIALAGNGFNERNVKSIDIEKKNELKSTFEKIDLKKFFDCWHGYKFTLVDCGGVKHSINIGGSAGSCGSYEEGSIVIHQMGTQYMTGCPQGPVSDISTAVD